MAAKWATLRNAGIVVAQLAGVDSEAAWPDDGAFPQAIALAGGWRLELAGQALDDLAAMMEPGLAALLAVHARGLDAGAPALALWQEIAAARAALLTLLPMEAAAR
ncbi:MAG: hypothetical protein JF593_08390 [Novosphingobium sp.]|nr:hypothetical protein [Novosphingobium sp.]